MIGYAYTQQRVGGPVQLARPLVATHTLVFELRTPRVQDDPLAVTIVSHIQPDLGNANPLQVSLHRQ